MRDRFSRLHFTPLPFSLSLVFRRFNYDRFCRNPSLSRSKDCFFFQLYVTDSLHLIDRHHQSTRNRLLNIDKYELRSAMGPNWRELVFLGLKWWLCIVGVVVFRKARERGKRKWSYTDNSRKTKQQQQRRWGRSLGGNLMDFLSGSIQTKEEDAQKEEE